MLSTVGRLGRMIMACVLGAAGWLFGTLVQPVPGYAAQLEFGGVARTYTLHVPPGATPPAGLVVNLHAAGASGPQQAGLTNYDAIADQYGFAVVYPDGLDLSWADGRGASLPDRQGVDDVGFLSALIGKLVADLGVNPGRVFVTGLSAGAFMANRLACDRADLIAAVAPVAGTLGAGTPCNPSRPVSVLESHGTADTIVPYGGGPMVGRGGPSEIVSATAMADRWRQADGCPAPVDDVLPGAGDGTSARRSTAAPCAGGTAVVLLSIDGGGHTWPSAPESGLPGIGSTSRAFNASLASVQFFVAHGR